MLFLWFSYFFVAYGVDYYKYFTFLLQELSIDLDEEYLGRLLDMFKFETAVPPSNEKLWEESFQLMHPQTTEQGQRMYFEVFQIQPMKINISFALSERKGIRTSE
jgi:vacuolar protein sorting-associated protein 13A/C